MTHADFRAQARAKLGAWLAAQLDAQTMTSITNRPSMRLGEEAIDFVLWLNGAVDVLSPEPPTPEQWAAIREKTVEMMGSVTRDRLRRAARPWTDSNLTAAAGRLTGAGIMGTQVLTGNEEALTGTTWLSPTSR